MKAIEFTPKQIGKRILVLRKQKGFSQDDLAMFLKMPRSSVTQMELGNRNITVIELMKLAEVLGFSIDRFLSSDYQAKMEVELWEDSEPAVKNERTPVPRFRMDKFRNVLLYLLEQCAGKPNVGETVLYKLLYYADFNFYELFEEHLTGAQYRKLPFGPVMQDFNTIISRMIKEEQIQRIKTTFHGYPQIRYIPLVKPDLTKMSAAETETIDRVIDRFSDWSASAVSEYSHKDLPWRSTKDGEVIDYELALYREVPFSVRTYNEDTEQRGF